MTDGSGPGPIEQREWPRELQARALSTGGERRLHGYAVESDLANNYAFSDMMLLALTGELPTDGCARAFGIALTFASAMSVAQAPVHASVLARLCGVRTGGILAIAAISLGEEVDRLLANVGSALDGATPSQLPSELRAHEAQERASVERLREALRDVLDVPVLGLDPCRDVALVSVLRACGLASALQIGAALTIARLPSVVAESIATKPGDFKSYPMDTPHFEYEAAKPPQSGIR